MVQWIFINFITCEIVSSEWKEKDIGDFWVCVLNEMIFKDVKGRNRGFRLKIMIKYYEMRVKLINFNEKSNFNQNFWEVN